MSSLLDKTRKITQLLQQKGSHLMQFTDLCSVLSELINSDVYVLSSKGKVLGLNKHSNCKIKVGSLVNSQIIMNLLLVQHTKVNVYQDKIIGSLSKNSEYSYTTIIPVICANERLGTLILARDNEGYTDEDIVIAEFGAMVVGMEILRSDKEQQKEKGRKDTEVKLAMNSLSYSEKQAIINILNEINGNEGILVVSRIADAAKITRSAVVNALRKLESAGVIESKSLGMKGTLIKILNENILRDYKN